MVSLDVSFASVLVLHVVPQIKLIPSLVFQRFGSNITLTCVPSNKTIPIFWLRNGQVIDDALFRPNKRLRHMLIIINAQSSDVGNYSCGLNMTGLPINSQSGEVILFNGNPLYIVIYMFTFVYNYMGTGGLLDIHKCLYYNCYATLPLQANA